MRRLLTLTLLVAPFVGLVTARAMNDHLSSAGGVPDAAEVIADVVATGIPGAGAITQIGTFHQGGPFHDNAALIGNSADPGHVLDRTRLFVASTSNFGAPLAIPGQAEGSILSIDATGGRVDITNAAFAMSASVAQPHPTTAGGAVMLYAAQSPPALHEPVDLAPAAREVAARNFPATRRSAAAPTSTCWTGATTPSSA